VSSAFGGESLGGKKKKVVVKKKEGTLPRGGTEGKLVAGPTKTPGPAELFSTL